MAVANFVEISQRVAAMKHSDARILTTHVGSLIRPSEFVAILKAIDAGDAQAARAYPDRLREAVAKIVREQANVGIDVVTDGEFGKSVGRATSSNVSPVSSRGPVSGLRPAKLSR
jgi:Cobalamin-independent synthase, Catalytic domain